MLSTETLQGLAMSLSGTVSSFTYISPCGKEQQSDQDNYDVQDETPDAPESPASDIIIPVISFSHPNIGNTPKYEAEE